MIGLRTAINSIKRLSLSGKHLAISAGTSNFGAGVEKSSILQSNLQSVVKRIDSSSERRISCTEVVRNGTFHNLIQSPLRNQFQYENCSIKYPISSFWNGGLFYGFNKTTVGTNLLNSNTTRGLTMFSMRKGKRKTVRAVVLRFFRLNWGAWIRPRIGRNRKFYLKNIKRKNRSRTHVFCSAQHSLTLDKMVCRFWREPKYYVNDPYEKYHTRNNFENTKNIGRKTFNQY